MGSAIRALKDALEFRPGEVRDVMRKLLDDGTDLREMADALIPYLRSISARTRAAAIGSLAALRMPAAWDALQSALGDGDPALRLEAVRAIGRADDENNIARLTAAARVRDPEVRKEAVTSLSGRSGEARDTALHSLIASDDPWIRRVAIEGLASAKPDKFRDEIFALLGDAHAAVRASAARLAAFCEDEQAFALLLPVLDDADKEQRRVARQRLDRVKLPFDRRIEIVGRTRPSRGPETEAYLEALCAPVAPAAMAELVGRYGPIADALLLTVLASRGDDGIRALDPILGGRDGARASAAIEALLALNLPGQMAALLDRWDGLHVSVRRLAVRRAATGEAAWLEEALERGASDTDAEVRDAAVRGLLSRDKLDDMPAESIPALLDVALGSAEWNDTQREKLSKVAGRSGPAAIPVLCRGAAFKAAAVRRACAQSLVALEARDALWGLRDSDDAQVVRCVALALADGKDARALEPLVRTIEEGKAEVKARKLLTAYEPEPTSERCLGWMTSRRASLRRHSAERLGVVGDEGAVPALLKAVSDPNYEVQFAAVLALKRFVARDEVVDRLLECLAAGEISVRQAAVEALGEGKVERAVPHLVKALGNPLLRKRAGEALRKIGDRQGQLALLRRRRREENIAGERERIAARNARKGRNISGPVKRKKTL